MLNKTSYTVSSNTLLTAQELLPNVDFKITINKPTGNFFYDAWVLNDEFIGTVWEEIYNSLPASNKGEARIIKLDATQSYTCHADIDDRYHLNIKGSTKSYIVDLENDTMYKTYTDYIWYDMDAGRLHSAVNFNNQPRYQLVVRKLLNNSVLADSKHVSIVAKYQSANHRFIFDQYISTWLNRANKNNLINSFTANDEKVSFNIDTNTIPSLLSILPEQFECKINEHN